MSRSLQLVVLALLGAAPAVAQSTPADLLTAYTVAWNAGDSVALAGFYADDPRTTTVGGGVITRGPVAVRASLADEVRLGRGYSAGIDSVTSDLLDPTRALLVASWHLRTPPPDPRTVGGAVTMLLVRRSARDPWRILQDHWSLVPDAPVALPADALAALPDSGPTLPTGALPECRVTRVVDGDTIECARIGRVRLIGIDTPERSQAPFGTQATEALTLLLGEARSIVLEADVEQRDRYDRLLAYVWVDGRMANWLLARSGWAVQLTYPPNVRYVERFSEAVAAAREENRGLWATGGFACDPRDRRRGKC